MIKFAYNSCCGVYDLSDKGISLYNKFSAQKGLPCYSEILTDGTHDAIYIRVIEELEDEAIIYKCCPDIFKIDSEKIIKADLNINTIDDYGVLYKILLNDDLREFHSTHLEQDYSNGLTLDDINSPSWFLTLYKRKNPPTISLDNYTSLNEKYI